MHAPNSMAQHLQGYGRGNDTMLVHMTPGEVGGLQQLAMAHGGSLTVNPDTGLPEAGFLENILPTILGVGLNFLVPGLGPLAAAGITGAGTAAITGDLNKGLMAGLGAFGGNVLGGALGGMGGAGGEAASKFAQEAGSSALNNVGQAAAQMAGHTATPLAQGAAANIGSAAPAAMAQGAPGLANIMPHAAPQLAQGAASAANAAIPEALKQSAGAAVQNAAPQGMIGQLLGPKAGEFADRFAQEAAMGGAQSPVKTGLAALGVGLPIMQSMQPKLPGMPKDEGFDYEGPYRPTERQVQFKGGEGADDSSEFSYFTPFNPYPGFEPAPKRYNAGGVAGLDTSPQFQRIAQMVSGGGMPVAGGQPPTSPVAAPPPPTAGMDDRMLRRPDANYMAGRGPEHNWNFRPVMPVEGMSSFTPKQVPTRMQAAMDNPLFGAIFRKKFGMTDPSQANPMAVGKNFRYDPRNQRVVQGMAAGGDVNLKNGAFVVDARTVSELGNGSSSAGQELLARYGGKPVQGPGDGVSDSVPASVEGRQRARVARDEVIFGPQDVSRLGEGDVNKGAQRLYALMDKAHKARKKAKRGQDTRVRKALKK